MPATDDQRRSAPREPRRLLVTGGAGFIGGNFVRHWTMKHAADSVTVLDALTYAGNAETIGDLIEAERVEFVHGDIRDGALLGRLFAERGFDVVVHFAAESHVDRSIADGSAFVLTNVVGTFAMLEAARRAWCHDGVWRDGVRFHHVSTDEVYGSLEPQDPAFTESTPYAPNSPYAASKAGSDHLVRAFAHTYGLPATISNCSNNYGPYHFPEKLIPLTIVNALDGKPLPVYGDGKQIRDWLFVGDHCDAIERILLAGRDGETYNVGGRAERENIWVVRALCRLIDEAFRSEPLLHDRFPNCPAARDTSCESLITHVRDRPGHDRRYAIDAARIATELGFLPSESLDSGLARTVRWFLDHERWWRRVMDGSYRTWMSDHYGQ